MSGGKGDPFAETVSCLVEVHRREVARLRAQVLQLRASLAEIEAAAPEAVAAARGAGAKAQGAELLALGLAGPVGEAPVAWEAPAAWEAQAPVPQEAWPPQGQQDPAPAGAQPQAFALHGAWAQQAPAAAAAEGTPRRGGGGGSPSAQAQHQQQAAAAEPPEGRPECCQSPEAQQPGAGGGQGGGAASQAQGHGHGHVHGHGHGHGHSEVQGHGNGHSEADQILAQADRYKTSTAKRMRVITRRVSMSEQRETVSLTCVVNHPTFDTVCAVMIIFNSILVGVTVERGTTSEDEELWAIVSGHACSIFFLVELLLRMYSQGREYYSRENRSWNFFDMTLVFTSMVDFAMNYFLSSNNTQSFTRSTGSILKIFKMLRIVRVFRVFRFFRELALLALLIVDSMCSLLWALLLLIMVIYVFAIWFTLQSSDYLKDHTGVGTPMTSEVHRQFGSLGRTVYSLVQSMLGGVSWGVVSDALFEVDYFSAGLFFFYISFCVLAVLNIITGVFVDNAFETARMQREFLVQKEMELRERYVVSMRALFQQMDADHSGSITLEEVQDSFKDTRVHSYFQALGLDPEDLERLFKLLDDDNSGELNLDEFLSGCLRLKGQARSIDLHGLIMQLKKLDSDTEERFRRLECIIHGCRRPGNGQRVQGQTLDPEIYGPIETMSF